MAREEKIGLTQGGMQLLKTLGFAAVPHPSYRPYSAATRLGNGQLEGNGFPVITWHWAFVTIAERDIFIDLLDPGALSGPVVIRSRKPDGSYEDFDAILNLPTGDEDLQVGRILNFDVTFSHCEEL